MAVQLQPNLGVVASGQPNLLVTPNPDLEPYNAHVFRLDQTHQQQAQVLREL